MSRNLPANLRKIQKELPFGSFFCYSWSVFPAVAAAAVSCLRNRLRKIRRVSGPANSSCQISAMGIFQPQVCTQVPKLGSLNSRVAIRLMVGHIRQTIIVEMA